MFFTSVSSWSEKLSFDILEVFLSLSLSLYIMLLLLKYLLTFFSHSNSHIFTLHIFLFPLSFTFRFSFYTDFIFIYAVIFQQIHTLLYKEMIIKKRNDYLTSMSFIKIQTNLSPIFCFFTIGRITTFFEIYILEGKEF